MEAIMTLASFYEPRNDYQFGNTAFDLRDSVAIVEARNADAQPHTNTHTDSCSSVRVCVHAESLKAVCFNLYAHTYLPSHKLRGSCVFAGISMRHSLWLCELKVDKNRQKDADRRLSKVFKPLISINNREIPT